MSINLCRVRLLGSRRLLLRLCWLVLRCISGTRRGCFGRYVLELEAGLGNGIATADAERRKIQVSARGRGSLRRLWCKAADSLEASEPKRLQFHKSRLAGKMDPAQWLGRFFTANSSSDEQSPSELLPLNAPFFGRVRLLCALRPNIGSPEVRVFRLFFHDGGLVVPW